MRTCDQCGFESNRDTARFCARCGRMLSSNALLSRGSVLHGRYRVVRVLGRGGMGAVYLVEDLMLYGKYWAAKELLERFSDASERAAAIAQFQREVQILVNLRHPNLPQVVDFFEEGGRHYLVMEFIEGQTLKEMLIAAPEGCLPEEQVLGWARQICDVLDYLHHHDPPVIFRDLKPANVMVTPQGQVKLIDFGVARLFDPAKGTDTLKMGTVGYAPPEQYSGQGQTTPRSDIYALGATLYELLTGDNPEAHPFVFHTVRRLRRGISPRTAQAIARAVQLDPNARFPSARAMKAALQEPRRHPLAVLVIALPLALLLLAGGGWWVWRNASQGTPVPSPTISGILIAQATPSPTATRRPTVTLAPTHTPSPGPTHTSTPWPTPSPTPTPSPIPTATRTAAPTQSGSPTPTPVPTATPLRPTPSPLPPPPGQLGRILYTIDAGGGSYYLATTDPTWSQGQMLDPVSRWNSSCSNTGIATTLTGQSFNLFYGYRCGITPPVKECPSPTGEYRVTFWERAGKYSVSVYRVSDGQMVQAIYDGPLNTREPLLWAPDGSRFYFTIDRTLHQASPYSAGYQPVLPIAYEPYLSPDGSMLLYLQPVGTVGAYDIWVANADGSNARNVTNAPGTYKLCARWGGY